MSQTSENLGTSRSGGTKKLLVLTIWINGVRGQCNLSQNSVAHQNRFHHRDHY
jgi:hypothetical protein